MWEKQRKLSELYSISKIFAKKRIFYLIVLEKGNKNKLNTPIIFMIYEAAGKSYFLHEYALIRFCKQRQRRMRQAISP